MLGLKRRFNTIRTAMINCIVTLCHVNIYSYIFVISKLFIVFNNQTHALNVQTRGETFCVRHSRFFTRWNVLCFSFMFLSMFS